MSSTLPIKIPNVGDISERVTIVDWYVTVGKFVNKGDLMAHLETSRSIIEVFSPVSGYVKTIVIPRGKHGKEGDNIVWVEVINKDDVALLSNKLANRITTMITSEGIDKAYTAGASASITRDEMREVSGVEKESIDVPTVNFLDKSTRNLDVVVSVSSVDVTNKGNNSNIRSDNENYKSKDRVFTSSDFINKPISLSTINMKGNDFFTDNNANDSDKIFIGYNNDDKLRHDTFSDNNEGVTHNILRGEILLNKIEVKGNLVKVQGTEFSLDAIFGKAIALAISDFNIFAARVMVGGLDIFKSPKVLFRRVDVGCMSEALLDSIDGKTTVDIDINLKDRFKIIDSFSSSLVNIREANFTFINNMVDGIVSSDIVLCSNQVASLAIHRVVNRVFVIDINQVVVVPCINFSLTYDCKVVDDKVATNFFIKIKDVIENTYFL